MALSPPLFQFDWIAPPDDMRSDELRATCANLVITVNGECPTLIADTKTNTARRSIQVPMYSIAEWIAFTWWQFHQVKSSERNHSSFLFDSSSGRHLNRTNMRTIGDGYIWPNLSFALSGGLVEVQWSAQRAEDARSDIRYLSSGTEYLPLEVFEEALAALVEAVLTRLDEQGLTATMLHDEWRALRQLDRDEVAFCLACGRLGIDPFSEGADLAGDIEQAFERLEPALLDEFLNAAHPQALLEDLTWVERAGEAADLLLQQEEQRGIDHRLYGLHAQWQLLGSKVRPFEIGYQQARAVRSALQLEPRDCISQSQLPVQSGPQPVSSRNGEFLGLSALAPDRMRVAVISGWPQSETSQRFLQARALWHPIFAGERGHLLLTSSASPTQQITRAFAAELLAPADGIKEMLSGAPASMVADHFGVSELLIDHQIENHP